jgi:hypothetical protein
VIVNMHGSTTIKIGVFDFGFSATLVALLPGNMNVQAQVCTFVLS